MKETEFVKICKISDLPNKRGRKFTIDEDTDIAVFKVNGKVYAVENTCPHNQSHVMYDGYIDENLYIACPIHGWQFHLETGEVPAGTASLSGKLLTYEVKIENDEVYVEKKKKKFKFWKW